MRKRKNLKIRKTRRNSRRKTRRKTRRKKGGENIFNKLGYINKKVDDFKEDIEKMKDFKDNVSLANNTLVSLKNAGIVKGKNVIRKIKSAKERITPCTVAAIADRISCSAKYFRTKDFSKRGSPKWFKEPPKHSRFLKTMCQNSQNIHNTLTPGNFDYFRPEYPNNWGGCQERTEEKLLKTSNEIERENALKSDKFYLNLSPEEKRKMKEQEENFKKEQGINLVSLQQKQHILAGQKKKVFDSKGRGKKKHLSKKAKKRRKEKKKTEKEIFNRMRQPVPYTSSPALDIDSNGSGGEEKSCAQILEDGKGNTPSSYAKWKKCDDEAKESEALIIENQKRREIIKREKREQIQTKNTRRNVKKNKKEFTQQKISVGGKRKCKTMKKRKRKTRRRR